MTTLTLSEPQSRITMYASEAGSGQMFMVARVLRGESAYRESLSAYSQIAEVLRERGMQIVHERIFGSLSVEDAVMNARRKAP